MFASIRLSPEETKAGGFDNGTANRSRMIILDTDWSIIGKRSEREVKKRGGVRACLVRDGFGIFLTQLAQEPPYIQQVGWLIYLSMCIGERIRIFLQII